LALAVLLVNLNQNIGLEKTQIIGDIDRFQEEKYEILGKILGDLSVLKILGDLFVLKVNYRRFSIFSNFFSYLIFTSETVF
jgi:hypothetical protein